MANDNGQKTSADLEREVNEQRNRVEARIGEIKERLSPGQLIDEVLSYSKDGGGKFASNFAQQITANPLPAALVGIGLAWLMGSNGKSAQADHSSSSPRYDYEEYPYAKISSGRLKRVSHASDDAGQWWSEFEGDGGARYKAPSNSLGHRAGHFTDAAGKKFSGFIDEAGNRLQQFEDEAGNRFDDASGWAQHSWQQAQRKLSNAVGGIASMAGRTGESLSSGTRDLGGTLQSQGDQLTRQVGALFDQQPLIAGALAFAAGAALGASLPHTSQEDQLIGKQADKIRRNAGEAAGKLYEKGKDQAAGLYEEATDKVGELYSETKDRIAGAQSALKH
jgi:hypothetical protein